MKKVIMIAMLFIPAFMYAQNRAIEVSGKVMDKETGQILQNSHVYINEHFGTLTDQKGTFKLEIPEQYADETLHVSYLGYETFETPVNKLNGEVLLVNLEIGAIWLDNVVVEADPWVDFRDIISEISANYENRKEFYAAVFTELEKMEIPEGENKDTAVLLEKGEEYEGGMLPGVIAFCIASIGLVFMAKPFLRLLNKKQ